MVPKGYSWARDDESTARHGAPTGTSKRHNNRAHVPATWQERRPPSKRRRRSRGNQVTQLQPENFTVISIFILFVFCAFLSFLYLKRIWSVTVPCGTLKLLLSSVLLRRAGPTKRLLHVNAGGPRGAPGTDDYAPGSFAPAHGHRLAFGLRISRQPSRRPEGSAAWPTISLCF